MNRRSILSQILSDVERFYGSRFSSIVLKDVYLRQVYTIVQLEDGSQGIALNYDNYEYTRMSNKCDVEEIEERLKGRKLEEPELCRILNGDTATLYEQSIRVALLSALSQPMLTEAFLSRAEFHVVQRVNLLRSCTREGDAVCIIGFGGLLSDAIEEPKVKRIFVSDLFLHAQRTAVEDVVKASEKEIIFSDGSDNDDLLRQSDIAVITGSALCNGTMDALLEHAAGCREVIIQGHSCSLFPQALFSAGVIYVVQNRIQEDILSYAKALSIKSGPYSSKFPLLVDALLRPYTQIVSRADGSVA